MSGEIQQLLFADLILSSSDASFRYRGVPQPMRPHLEPVFLTPGHHVCLAVTLPHSMPLPKLLSGAFIEPDSKDFN